MRISDWSSDVCSSDLPVPEKLKPEIATTRSTAGSCPKAASTCSITLRVRLALASPGACMSTSRKPWSSFGRKAVGSWNHAQPRPRSEEHTSELQSLMRISYAVFCLKKKKTQTHTCTTQQKIYRNKINYASSNYTPKESKINRYHIRYHKYI